MNNNDKENIIIACHEAEMKQGKTTESEKFTNKRGLDAGKYFVKQINLKKSSAGIL